MKKSSKLIISLIKGIVKAIPVVNNLKHELKDNKKSKEGGKNKYDYPRLFGYSLSLGAIIGRIIFPEYINLELLNNIGSITGELLK